MADLFFEKIHGSKDQYTSALASVMNKFKSPFKKGDSVGVKLHWGEKGNQSFLPPLYAREIVNWLHKQEVKPFVFDTTALYSGGRRTGTDALKTAFEHGYTESYLGSPIIIADGLDGLDVVEIPAGYKHFKTVQVASVIDKADGFFIFSHFKGHMASFFGGAIKNLSMGFGSRAQKQRMHSDAKPFLSKKRCTKCGVCVGICPVSAAEFDEEGYPKYNHDSCIGCAQCIAVCPELALKILWSTEETVFQEKLVETAAAVWQRIKGKTLFVNALLNITVECDCLTGENPVIAPDIGFVGGYHPIDVDYDSLYRVGPDTFENVHPNIPWQRQFSYSKEIGFTDSMR